MCVAARARAFDYPMRTKRTLELSNDVRKQAIASIRRHLHEEFDQDIGDLKASVLLDYFLAELGPSLYNMGVADAKAVLVERVEDLASLSLDEFTYWPASSRRRA